MIRKTLVYTAPKKYGRMVVWDITTKALRDIAYVDLFKILNQELGAYQMPDSVTCALLPLAQNGNPEACEALLCYRRNKMGEQFEEVEIRAPDLPVLLDSEPRPVVSVSSLELDDISIVVEGV